MLNLDFIELLKKLQIIKAMSVVEESETRFIRTLNDFDHAFSQNDLE